MTVSGKLRIILLTGLVGFLGLEAAEQWSTPGATSFVSAAEARVGRPLSPSVSPVWRGARPGAVRPACITARCRNGPALLA
jgi:hypothetical protein